MDTKGDLIGAIVKRTQDLRGNRRLTCASAFKLAEEFRTEAAEIGRICNQQNIRICKCQLGCFK